MSSIVNDLNSLIIELDNKEQTDESDLIYYNIITQYNNYLTDISFSDTVDELIAPLTSPYNSINGKKNTARQFIDTCLIKEPSLTMRMMQHLN